MLRRVRHQRPASSTARRSTGAQPMRPSQVCGGGASHQTSRRRLRRLGSKVLCGQTGRPVRLRVASSTARRSAGAQPTRPNQVWTGRPVRLRVAGLRLDPRLVGARSNASRPSRGISPSARRPPLGALKRPCQAAGGAFLSLGGRRGAPTGAPTAPAPNEPLPPASLRPPPDWVVAVAGPLRLDTTIRYLTRPGRTRPGRTRPGRGLAARAHGLRGHIRSEERSSSGMWRRGLPSAKPASFAAS